ncbi:hypothetical protein BC827DRAFT_1378443 [Russula dissimulans]|nr:hypothetical protein BC827DRAFT_1378443 [Russula dissimulans]
MRIRILSETNLPSVRSWFNVDKENSLASLKSSLCASVPALRDAHIPAAELVLILDDFELLDDSPVRILRDGDLICLRLRTHLPKRKAEVLEGAPPKRHRPLRTATDDGATVQAPGRSGILNRAPGHLGKGISTQSSSSSTNSSSKTSSCDTSSNSESTSTSESSSDSDFDSTSSDDHPPHPHPPPSSEPPRKTRHQTPAPVPPGSGKPGTHARNERRRRKRLAERQLNVIPPVPTGSSNAIPLGISTSVDPPEPMMMSLKNKNKRRGFKNTACMLSHITFQDNDVAPSPPSKLIPPSQRHQLPPGLFVTSVDVEADVSPMYGKQVRDRKRKKTERDSYGQEEADIVLDYTTIPEEDSTAATLVPDYTRLEKAWVNAPLLTEKAALPIGCVVGWQELGINPTTLTPETMLFVARVVASGESGAVVVRLRRPGLGIVSFAGGDLEDEEEEEEFSWAQILEMNWRLVSNSN